MKGRVVIFSIVGCPHCLRAKNRLAELEIPYSDVNLDSYPQCREEAKRLSGGRTTVPQIFFNQRHIGGNDELQKLLADKGRLDEALAFLRDNEPGPDAPAVPDPTTAVDYGKNDEFVCEPDEYVALTRDLRASGLIKDQREGLFTKHKAAFKGQDLIDWLRNEKGLDEARAMEMAAELLTRNFGSSLSSDKSAAFDPKGYYRLIEDDEGQALNAGPVSECKPIAATDLGEQLRRLILSLYNVGLSKDGHSVDYAAIQREPSWEKYKSLTRELQRLDLAGLSREDKLAFFINMYNALVIHASIAKGKPSNLWQRYKFFNTSSYIIGGHLYSLQDIENGILRGNRKGVGMFRKSFGSGDPRASVALAEAEPLIHFALNCGAVSCPPIKTFSAKGVVAELKVAGEAFMESEDGVLINEAEGTIGISQLFKWYSVDFGSTKEAILQFILDHMAEGEKKKAMAKLLKYGSYKLHYLPYNWDDNTKQ